MTNPFVILGTVQLGLSYGLKENRPLLEEAGALELLKAAVDLGIRQFDTAPAYGDAQRKLGLARANGILPSDAIIYTKLSPEPEIDSPSVDTKSIERVVRNQIENSLSDLKQRSLENVSLHRWNYHSIHQGRVWKTLLNLQQEGKIHSLGASVYGPEEAIEALADPDITHLQLPHNLLDWRWESKDFAQARLKRPDVTISVRSIFLQGLLSAPANRWPNIEGYNAQEKVSQLENFAKKFGLSSRAELCFAFAKSVPWISNVVIGVDSKTQLQENIRLASLPALSLDQRNSLSRLVPVPEKLLNPSLWPQPL